MDQGAREAPDSDGCKVEVKRSKAKTQSGKSDIKERPRRWKNIDGKDKGKPVDILTRIKDHTGIMAVSPEQWVELRLTVDSGAGESVIGEADAGNVGIEKGKRTG